MDESVRIAKQMMRTEMRRLRRALPDRVGRSERIWAGLEPVLAALAGESSLSVFAFRGVSGEPETDPWIVRMQSLGYEIGLPRCEGSTMVVVNLHEHTLFETSTFGIPEPLGAAIDPSYIDVVIVPGLAFTETGQRLGQGGGYYDRYLPMLRKDCVTIAVCFEPQIVAAVPGEAHDQTVDMIVTDQRVLRI